MNREKSVNKVTDVSILKPCTSILLSFNQKRLQLVPEFHPSTNFFSGCPHVTVAASQAGCSRPPSYQQCFPALPGGPQGAPRLAGYVIPPMSSGSNVGHHSN